MLKGLRKDIEGWYKARFFNRSTKKFGWDSMSTENAEYLVRTYKKGDEEKLVQLFNDVYRKYAGFTPRTPEFWLWCCRNRPGVQDEGIFIVDKEGEIVGYAVVDSSGEILEFCYDSKYVGRAVVLKLLECSLDYLENVGASSVSLNVPFDDFLLREACQDLGFAEASVGYALQLSVVDFPQLIGAILKANREKVKNFRDEEILVKVSKGFSLDSEYITLRFHDGEFSVEPGNAASPGITIDTDRTTLTSCIFGKIKPIKAILGSGIKVRPWWKIRRALELFSMLQVNDPWYVPGADYG